MFDPSHGLSELVRRNASARLATSRCGDRSAENTAEADYTFVGEFPPYTVSPRAEDRGGHRPQVELVLQSTPTCHVLGAIFGTLAPEKLHVAEEVGGRIRIPGESLLRRRGSGAAWESAAAKLTDPNRAEPTRNKPWIPPYGAYDEEETGRLERRCPTPSLPAPRALDSTVLLSICVFRSRNS
ncbi:hypothetical protein CFIO01_04406 [Colletotrichum fioriniae PJ7]|uniref:Uncharacterized protein n=1 Tax=Colletotrichum fioriniae PJ7 TaxID=1445577 RepID=A0A010SKP3_9PEZI|nr:hypothetical protein CFIO01_04406 [Colletotrichum fioriniae PJ7]